MIVVLESFNIRTIRGAKRYRELREFKRYLRIKQALSEPKQTEPISSVCDRLGGSSCSIEGFAEDKAVLHVVS